MAVELKDLAPLLLRKERASGDLDAAQLAIVTNTLRGGVARNARRKQLEQLVKDDPVLSDRDMVFRNHTERYNFGIKKVATLIKLITKHKLTTQEEIQELRWALGENLPLDLHDGMFVPVIETQATDEQKGKWLQAALDYKILGAYAQTELGHGSNVQGIETTAHFDKATQEFIINSPTLTSRKWWPGALGKTATHAIVYARLFLEGKDVGVHAFMMQLRSLKDHQPLPGIEVGDIGPKVGFNSIDNGYCAFDNVHIPRDHMFMRFVKVLSDGTFVEPQVDKVVYLTMVYVRAYLLQILSIAVGKAATISTRFSAARVQGRKGSGSNAGEFQVLDYQNQQLVLFPLIALSYASNFMSNTMIKMHDSALELLANGEEHLFGEKLAELHGISSGIKAWLADHVSNGIEAARRSCGGHGFTLSSNLNHLFSEIVGSTTYEGTMDVLVQQHARYLLKVLLALQTGKRSTLSPNSSVGFLAQASQYFNPTLRFSAQRPEDLDNLELLIEALKVRATRIVVALAQQMRDSNNDSNACMITMTRASTAHSELLLVSTFAKSVEAFPAGPAKDTVSSLCGLFGASLIVQNLNDFRDHDYFSTAQANLARQQLARLLPIVRRNAVPLTDAWEFSDFDLNSTIGRYDGDIYRALVKRAADEPLNKTQVAESYELYLKPLIQASL
uniref:Acyl-coenzyme A oxidase n=1 Tax=Globisporangium ultimum (strain ATCC 200006 / CBS 805.95 / DAOM BR144) TaxID=431595 RepID=K3WP98_GLOUD